MNIKDWLSKLINIGLLATLLTPFLVSSDFLFPFLSPKVIVFQILIEIIFVLWLWLAVLDTNYRLKSSSILLGLSIFLFFNLISAVAGVDFYRSFWGISERLTGLFLELHFFALFLVLVGFLKSDSERWIKFLTFSFWASVAVGFTALYQHILPYLNIQSIFTKLSGERVSGVFGSPGFLAPYLLFYIFFGFWLFDKHFKEGLKTKASAFLISSSFLIFILLLGATRGAVLGLALGVFFLLFALAFSDFGASKIKKYFLALIIILFFSFIFILLERNSKLVQTTPFLTRFTEYSSATPRLVAWQIALKGAGDKLFFGVGPGNFNYLFNKYYEPRLLKFGIGETWFDKPHNAYLEVLTESGLIGFLAYAFLFAVLFKTLWRLYKSESKSLKLLSVLLASAILSYLVQNLFLFDSFGSWLALFIFMAFLASLTQGRALDFKGAYLICALIFSILALLAISFNYSTAKANILDAQALKAFGSNTDKGILFFKKALSQPSPYRVAYQLDFAASVFGAIQKNVKIPDLEGNVNLALEMMDQVLANRPKDASVYNNLMNFYGILGERGKDKTFLNVARDYGKKSLELSPKRQETIFYLSRVELLAGNADEAIRLNQKAVSFDPEIADSHWYLGLSLVAANRVDEGRTEIKKAMDLGYRPKSQSEGDFISKILKG